MKSLSSPANSTPVGPPPTTTMCSSRSLSLWLRAAAHTASSGRVFKGQMTTLLLVWLGRHNLSDISTLLGGALGKLALFQLPIRWFLMCVALETSLRKWACFSTPGIPNVEPCHRQKGHQLVFDFLLTTLSRMMPASARFPCLKRLTILPACQNCGIHLVSHNTEGRQ